MLGTDHLIDPDARRTWPDACRYWAEHEAGRLAGSAECSQDLAISPEQEDDFRRPLARGRSSLTTARACCHTRWSRSAWAGCACLMSDSFKTVLVTRSRIARSRKLRTVAQSPATSSPSTTIKAASGRSGSLLGGPSLTTSPKRATRYCDIGAASDPGGPSHATEFATVGMPSIVVVGLDHASAQRPLLMASRGQGVRRVFSVSIVGTRTFRIAIRCRPATSWQFGSQATTTTSVTPSCRAEARGAEVSSAYNDERAGRAPPGRTARAMVAIDAAHMIQ